MSNSNNTYDIIISGAGLAGLVAANMFAEKGFKIALLEKGKILTGNEKDIRSSALNFNSYNILREFIAKQDLSDISAKIDDIIVLNNSSDSQLNFHKNSVSDNPMGFIVLNREIKNLLFAYTKQNKNIEIFENNSILNQKIINNKITVQLANGNNIKADLLIFAQGKYAKILKEQKIDILRYDHQQTAFTFLIKHQKHHLNLAIEHFLPDGPVASLPLLDKFSSSVVWSLKNPLFNEFQKKDNDFFVEHLNKYLAKYLGEISISSPLASFPLSASLALNFSRERILFMGDSIHSMHPLSGQGFNLTMRDIYTLSNLLVKQKLNGLDIGQNEFLHDYLKKIFNDGSVMVASMCFLNAVFSNDNKILNFARNFGLTAIEHMPLLKNQLIAYAMGIKANPILKN